MPAVLERPQARRLTPKPPPPLENGDELDADEFLRRYELFGDDKKAELIAGVVYMPPPVSLDSHAEPDNLLQVLLGTYSIFTPGTRAAANATARLSPWDIPQPDALLRILPDYGGRTHTDADGYLAGAPELVIEIATTSASIDTRRKKQSYLEAGVQEYLVWRTRDEALDWWELIDGTYTALTPHPDGTLRSRIFPGLWLHLGALLSDDRPAVLQKLQEGLASQEHQSFVAQLATYGEPLGVPPSGGKA